MGKWPQGGPAYKTETSEVLRAGSMSLWSFELPTWANLSLRSLDTEMAQADIGQVQVMMMVLCSLFFWCDKNIVVMF